MPSTVFDNAISPQRLALDWMLQDPYTLDLVDDDNRLVQRFALAVFYFATNGPTSWKLENRDSWLLSSTECPWGITLGGYNVECTNDVVDDISLWNDGLFGTIPGEIALLNSLTRLVLFQNNLEGTIPTEIGLLSSLTVLSLDSNRLDGSIPTEIGPLTSLTSLALHQNNLEGAIPTEIGLLSSLKNFVLASNNLEGGIPTEIGLLSSLTNLDLSRNATLSGRVPTELGNLSNLERLYLYDSQLTGSIPSNLCSSTLLWRAWIDCGEIECDCCTSIDTLGETPC